MPCCCRSAPCAELFTAKEARKNLRRYRRKGVTKLERQMIASVPAEVVRGARVLEIGGGIGALQAELLKQGAGSGEIIELVPAYEPYAQELAREIGMEDRSAFRVVDVLDHPEQVAPADVVILNRVVCCSPDGVQLTSTAARLARHALLLCYPRDRWLVRIGIRLVNFGMRILKRSYRSFLHPITSIHRAAQDEGFTITELRRGLIWEFVSLQRAT